jgi:hypothetical protein
VVWIEDWQEYLMDAVGDHLQKRLRRRAVRLVEEVEHQVPYVPEDPEADLLSLTFLTEDDELDTEAAYGPVGSAMWAAAWDARPRRKSQAKLRRVLRVGQIALGLCPPSLPPAFPEVPLRGLTSPLLDALRAGS